jgi:ABC-2 type transport system ATP-binding protein
VPTGLIYGLVGPSGAGKTTLMRAVAGVQRLAGGELRVLGLADGRVLLDLSVLLAALAALLIAGSVTLKRAEP